MKNKSVQLSGDSHFELKKMADKLEKNIGEVAEQCILYVSKKHIDPFNLKEGNPMEAINKYHDHTIGFITTFEKTKLTPILDNLTIVYSNIREALVTMPNKESQAQMLRILGEMKTYFNHHHNELVTVKEALLRFDAQNKELVTKYKELAQLHNRLIENNKSLTVEISHLRTNYLKIHQYMYNSLLEFTENLESLQLLTGKDKIKSLNVAFLKKFEPLLADEFKNRK